MRNVASRLSIPEKYCIFSLFEDMYADRRRYWLINLYRNPIIISQFVAQIVLYCIRFIPNSASISVRLIRILGTNNTISYFTYSRRDIAVSTILATFSGATVSPRLSLSELHSIIGDVVSKIRSTHGELAVGGAIAGGGFGSMLIPEPTIMLLFAMLGSLFGLGGKSLQEIKDDVTRELITECSKGIDQIIDRVTRWVTCAKADLYEAAASSFYANCCKLDKLIVSEKSNTRSIAYTPREEKD